MTHYLPGPRPDDLPISAAVWDAAKRDGKVSEAVAITLYEAVKQLEEETQQICTSMADDVKQSPEWFTRADLADRWQMHPVTLQQWAARGQGPPCKKFGGRVRYKLADVETWENTQDGAE